MVRNATRRILRNNVLIQGRNTRVSNAASTGIGFFCNTAQTSTLTQFADILCSARPPIREFSSKTPSSPFDPKFQAEVNNDPAVPVERNRKRKRRKVFIPRKAAVALTDRARKYFSILLENKPRPNVVGILVDYTQLPNEPRMVFSFQFVNQTQLDSLDRPAEPVSLEMVTLKDAETNSTVTQPKSPPEAWDDGLDKIYISPNAFFKVLGATLDVEQLPAQSADSPPQWQPFFQDAQGIRIDPNV